jgi:hypothetical protein
MDQLRRVKRPVPAATVVLALVAAVVTASAPDRGAACSTFTVSVPSIRMHIGPGDPSDFRQYGAPAAAPAPGAGTVHVDVYGPITVTPDCG